MTRLESIEARALEVPFKVAFKHASAERDRMQSLWVTARSDGGAEGMGEGCPREYVTGESLPGALAFVERHRDDWRRSIAHVASLREYVRGAERLIDANPAAWCAVELALCDLFGRAAGRRVEALLGTPPPAKPFRYTAVLGDAPPAAFEKQLAHYRAAGFVDFKVKLAGDRARDAAKVSALRSAGVPPESARADANNLFTDADAAAAYLSALGYPFFALEEPLRAGDYDGMRRLAKAIDARIILDESATRRGQLAALREDPHRWIVNLRVSKMGGLLRSLALVEAVRGAGLLVIVGAHVGETSVLSRAALTVAEAARDILVAQEGAFGTHLLERDVAQPPLMFGAGGRLVPEGLDGPGLGLAITPP